MKGRTEEADGGRKRLFDRLRRRLLAGDWPRLEMSLIVAGTGAAGFVCSFLLLRCGIRLIWLRYVLAVAAAYGAFLGLLRFWIWRHCDGRDTWSSGPDLGDLAVDLPGGGGRGGAKVPAPFSRGGGGTFGGGGASGSFADAAGGADGAAARAFPVRAPTPAGGRGFSFSGFGFDFDLDELTVVIALLAAVAGALAASLWIIVTAPTLLAELLLDGMLVTGLYRRMKRLRRQSWLHTAFDRTALAFAAVALLFGLLGWAIRSYSPRARSIGDAYIEYRVRHPG